MNKKTRMLLNKLKDDRSKKVIFLSHCILNENTRYLGGAFRKGSINEILKEIQKRGIGIVQMKCPEKEAWGGVLKELMWTPLYYKNRQLRRLLLPVFVWYTKRKYGKIAKEVVREIRDYIDSGFDVVGIVGISTSPTCGVNKCIDMEKFTEFLENSNINAMNRKKMNCGYIKSPKVHRDGLFVVELKTLLRKSNLRIKFYEHDLVKEMTGKQIKFNL